MLLGMDPARIHYLMDLAGVTDKPTRERLLREATELGEEDRMALLSIRQAKADAKVEGLERAIEGLRGSRSVFQGALHAIQVLYATTLFFLFGKGG